MVTLLLWSDPAIVTSRPGSPLATAVVAALVALVGVLIARGLFDIPVLAPAREGALGDSSTARLAVVSLLTLVAVLAPFTTDATLAIGSLVSGAARSAIRLGAGRPRGSPSARRPGAAPDAHPG